MTVLKHVEQSDALRAGGVAANRFRRAGALAGGIAGFFPILGSSLPPGVGLVAYLLSLAIVALVVWPTRAHGSAQQLAGLFAALVLACIVGAREVFDGLIPPQTALALAAGVAGAILLAITGSSRRSVGFFAMFVGGGTVLASGEAIRVLAGGNVHASVVAFGLNPIILAHYSSLAALVALVMLVRGEWRFLGLISFAVCVFGTILTASRGPVIGLVVGAIFVLLTRGGGSARWMRGLGARLVALLYVLVLALVLLGLHGQALLEQWLRTGDEDGNASTRVRAWDAAWSTIRSHPLSGGGIGRYAEGAPGFTLGLPDYPHNLLLESWAEAGFFAGAALVIALALVARRAGLAGAPFVIMGVIDFSVSGSLNSSVTLWICCAFALIMGTREIAASRTPRIKIRQTPRPAFTERAR